MLDDNLDNNLNTIEDLDLTYIKSKIQEVLIKAHSDSRKHKIREYSDRFQFSCPICGDSVKSPGRKLRGNLYLKNMHYVCFNETGCNRSFIKLLKTFNIDIDLQKKLDIYNYIDTNIQYKKEDNFVINKLDRLIDIDFLTEEFNNNPETNFSNFSTIKHNSAVYQYLKYQRLIENFDNIYEAEYSITPKWKERVLVLLNKSNKKVLGLQIRNLKSGDKRMFKTFNFEKLHNMLHPEDPLDEIEALSYNKLSNFYNILNVNWEQPVTIFEGYLDSIFFPNSIGAIGLNSIDEMNFLMSEDLNLQFFFDQDYVGVKKSLSMLEKGHKVFLWQKLNENIIKNKKDKYEANRYMINIKDLNKLVQEMKNTNPYTKLKLNEYFSKDYFDKLYLDYSLYPKPVFKNKNKNK
jgi:uncharacterized short protein YbdD (DUF466 family)